MWIRGKKEHPLVTVLQVYMRRRDLGLIVGTSCNTEGSGFFHLENNDNGEEDNDITYLIWEELLEILFLRLSTVWQ